jgi:prepilin-type N-terminal cleavage/methylation domain-containing protein
MNQARQSRGFSLTEVMVSMGVLAVGMAMVGAAFPAALLENRKSIDSTLSVIVAENAASVCQSTLSHEVLKNQATLVLTGTGLTTLGDMSSMTDISSLIEVSQRAYPVPEGVVATMAPVSVTTYNLNDGTPAGVVTYGTTLNSVGYNASALAYNPADWRQDGGTWWPVVRVGWLVAARRVSAGANDYILAIVPYRSFQQADRPPYMIASGGAQVNTRFFSTLLAGAPVGSPVICKGVPPAAGDPTYSTIVASGALSSTVSNAWKAAAVLAVGSFNNDNTLRNGTASPALGCRIVRTTLKP